MICVWYISNELEHLTRSVQQMSSYNWVDKIVIVWTGKDKVLMPFNGNSKVYWYDEYFGDGFDTSFKEGGFNEIDARNFAIGKAKETGADWLIQCDSDEFFTDSTINIIRQAQSQGKDRIWVECWHAFAPNIFLDDPLAYTRFGDTKYHDVHPRINKASIDSSFYKNPNEEFINSFKNQSLHCVQVGTQHNHYAKGTYHIHTHDLFPSKRRKLFPGAEYRIIENVMPDLYIKDFLAQQ